MSIRNFSEISHQPDPHSVISNHSYPSLDREQQSKRRKTNSNARFDRMIETMSVIHTHNTSSKSPGSTNSRHSKKKGRRVSAQDTYSPPVPSTLGRDLSFIKMDRPLANHSTSEDDLRSSDTADSKSSAHRRTCNPLPTWLANTFMSLSRKHPLRLLLPPTIQSAVNRSPVSEANTVPQEVDSDPVDNMFAFNRPALTIDADQEPTCQLVPNSQPSLLTKSIIQDANAASDTNLNVPVSEKFPFSTPGPGHRSVLGSSTESTILALRSPPRTPSSPTIYDDSRSGLDLRRVEPHTFCNSSDSGCVMNDRVQNDCNVESDSLASDLADSSLFSEIYATPGPGYYSSRPIYYDYPAEDPLGSASGDSFGMLCDEIDFQWQPFDRTNLVAPNISTRAAFAYGLGESIEYVLSDKPAPKEENPATLLQGLQCPLSPAANEHPRAATESPCPFRFVPPPESDPNRAAAAAVVPEIQEPVSNTAMAPLAAKLSSAHVPGITPRVGLPYAVTPLPGFNITGRGTNEMTFRRSPSPFEHVGRTKLTNLPTYANEAVEHNGDSDAKAIYSQASNDSIESWGYDTEQDIMWHK